MKTLVVGANGQLGRELVNLGKQMGIPIIASGRAELDMTRPEDISSAIRFARPDVIINAASYTAVDKAEEETDQAFLINRTGPANLATACAKNGITLVHISTDYVFDGAAERPYIETDTPNPETVYGRSKLAGDEVIAASAERYYIIRTSWVFGAYGQNFVSTMLRLGEKGEELKVVADQFGCPTWARDIASIIFTITARLENDRIPWGTYHYSGAPKTNWYDFSNAIFDLAARLEMIDRLPRVLPVSTEESPTLAMRPLMSVLDCSKIMDALDITRPNWEPGLKAVLEIWKQQSQNPEETL
ncbi:MAG: dTDP-4-dehydrorhamnose reductase [Pyrinomonadaceae bacterium]|nr:dTDP-4-dehydrorhamnose reductase [Pyrinomonadaceae bacterium]